MLQKVCDFLSVVATGIALMMFVSADTSYVQMSEVKKRDWGLPRSLLPDGRAALTTMLPAIVKSSRRSPHPLRRSRRGTTSRSALGAENPPVDAP